VRGWDLNPSYAGDVSRKSPLFLIKNDKHNRPSNSSTQGWEALSERCLKRAVKRYYKSLGRSTSVFAQEFFIRSLHELSYNRNDNRHDRQEREIGRNILRHQYRQR